MPLAEAIAEKHFEPRSGKFVEPKSGLTYTLREAVDHGMIDGDSAQFTNPGNKKTTTLKDALDKKMLDSYGKWTSPLTGKQWKYSLLPAVWTGEGSVLADNPHSTYS